MNKSRKRIISRLAKWIGGLLLGLLILLCVAILLIRSPAVQKRLVDRLIEQLSSDLNTTVSVGSVSLSFFDQAIINGVFIADQVGDTLVYADQIKVDIGLFSLFKKQVILDKLSIQGLHIRLAEDDQGRSNTDSLLSALEGKDDQGSQNQGSSWDIQLKQFDLDDYSLHQMIQNQSRLEVTGGTIKATVKTLNSDTKSLTFTSLDWSDSRVDYIAFINIPSSKTPTDSPSSASFLPSSEWTVNVDRLAGANNAVRYIQDPSLKKVTHFNMTNIDVADVNFDFENLVYTNQRSTVKIAHVKGTDHSGLTLSHLQTDLVLTPSEVVINHLSLETPHSLIAADASVVMDKTSGSTSTSPPIDIHFFLRPSHTTPADIRFFGPDFSSTLTMAPSDKIHLSGKGSISPSTATLTGMDLRLAQFASARLDATVSHWDMPGLESVDLTLSGLKTSPAKLNRLIPSLNIPVSYNSIGDVELSTQLVGNLNNLLIKTLNIREKQGSFIRASGHLVQLDDLQRIGVDLTIDTLFTTSQFILPFIPDTLASLIRQLDTVSYVGHIQGSSDVWTSGGTLRTSAGQTRYQVELDVKDGLSEVAFSGNASFEVNDLSAWTGEETLGQLATELRFDGKGIQPESMLANISGNVSLLEIGNQTVHNIRIDAGMNNKAYTASVKFQDDLGSGDVSGTLILDDSLMTLDAVADIQSLKLKSLGLSEVVNNSRLLSQIQLTRQGQEDPEGTLFIDRLELSTDSITWMVEDLRLSSMRNSQSGNELVLTSSLADAIIHTRGSLSELPAALSHLYYNTVHEYTGMQLEIPDAESQLSAVRHDSLHIVFNIHQALPEGLFGQQVIPLVSKASFDLIVDSDAGYISLNLRADSLLYTNYSADSVQLSIQNVHQNNRATLAATNMSYDNIRLPRVNVESRSYLDSIAFHISIRGDTLENFLRMGGLLTTTDSMTTITLDNALVVNDTDWSIHRAHRIKWGHQQWLIDSLLLTNGDRSFFVNGSYLPSGQASNWDFDVLFNDFPVDYISHAAAPELADLAGELNGNISLKGSPSNPLVSAAIAMTKLNWQGVDIGEAQLSVQDEKASNAVLLKGSLTHKNDLITFDGSYGKSSPEIDATVGIKAFDLSTLEPMLEGMISQTGGQVTGLVSLNGLLSDPQIRGRLSLKDVHVLPQFAGTAFAIDSAVIELKKDTIELGQIVMSDAMNRPAIITGRLLHSNYSQFESDLALSTEGFRFLNTSITDNDLFYGQLNIKTDATIRGPLTAPRVTATAVTAPQTILTVTELATISGVVDDGMVIFSSPDQFEQLTDALSQRTSGSPLSLDLNLELTNDAIFQFTVDEASGDRLMCRGNANLNVVMRPGQDTKVYGTYTVSSGEYDYSYGRFINKKFTIREGSTVVFNGDPMAASFNVTAVYSAQTSPYGLIKNESTLSASELAFARRRMGVNVMMDIKGQLDAPEINFDIQMPEASGSPIGSAISDKLNALKSDPTAMNNQVFGLLLTNGFIVADESSGGGGSSIAKLGTSQSLSSLSSFLADNLNKFAKEYIKGVDVDFNIDSYQIDQNADFTSSMVTQVGVGVSKRLLNDRLTLQATGNLDFQDNQQAANYTTIVGNFVLEYTLTATGNTLLRVYRQDHQDTLTGEKSAKNGIGIIFKKSFDDRTN